MPGLLQIEIGNPPPAPQDDEKAKSVADALGSTLYARFMEWRDARREKEEEWLEALRAYNGQYDAAKLQEIGANRSKVFVHITRTKTLAAYSRIIDLMLGNGDHWSIDPTPEPDLSAETLHDMYRFAESVMPGVDLSRDEARKLAERMAGEAAGRMRRRIQDQLDENRYEHLFKQAVLEMCILGTGALKGPVTTVIRSQRWSGAAGQFSLTVTEKEFPGIYAPSIFDLYPDPYATSMDDAIGIFERHVVTAQQMRELAGYPGFDAQAIEQIIADAPNGNHEDYLHDYERRRIAGTTNQTSVNRRYDLFEYWGQVRGHELAAAGLDLKGDELEQEYQANVWFCGSRTICARLNPLTPERLPYQLCPYERIPHQIWGIGVPMQMKDSQTVINATVRATLDNLGISSGPQVEVNMSLLAPGDDPRDLYPWRVWRREGGDPSQPLLRFYQPDNVGAGLMTVTEMFRRFADEETSLPSYTHGEQRPGLNKTASGMSMLMGAANVALKSIIKNLDSYLIEPTIRGMYDWNMRWSNDASIKGDMQVSAKGSTALLAKEIQSQRIIQFMQITANPVDAQLMGAEKRIGLIRRLAMSLDLDPDEVAPSEPDGEAGTSMPGMAHGPEGDPAALV